MAKKQTSFDLTSIESPKIWFKGRFQARFATNSDYYNEKRGTPKGWNFALEGEPDFVPEDSVPTSIDKPVGREIRFNTPVDLRTYVPPIGVKVISITGIVGSNVEEYFVGDPVIGKQVDLGPHTYLASNKPINLDDPKPVESYNDAMEPMALFEFHIADMLSGRSRYSHDRPFANGLPLLSEDEKIRYDVTVDPFPIPSLTFDNARKNILLADYRSLSPSDKTGTIRGRNLATRIAHLGGDIDEGIRPLKGTLSVGWAGKEEYVGLINDSILFKQVIPGIMGYFRYYDTLHFFARMFNYHSDEQCGQVHGCISTKPIIRDYRPSKASPNNLTDTNLILKKSLLRNDDVL